METGDQAACFHMARVFENAGDFEKAVNFYTKARAFSSAIRIAKVRKSLPELKIS